MLNAVLCYVEGCWAYFTTQPLNEQWGDDWNDVSYEHNAEEPYEGEDWQIYKLAFEGPYETPADMAGISSRYSVEMINNKEIPWLSPPQYSYSEVRPEPIYAGDTMMRFIDKVQSAGGEIYTRLEKDEDIV